MYSIGRSGRANEKRSPCTLSSPHFCQQAGAGKGIRGKAKGPGKIMKTALRILPLIISVCMFSSPIPAFSQEAYRFELMWGSEGTAEGQFKYPYGIAIDSLGNVYVADTGNDRIQKFDPNGNFIVKWGSYGTGDGQFSIPDGVAVDLSGNAYVADNGNQRIQRFDLNGNFITKWDVTKAASFGLGGIALDPLGNVYVTVYYQCFGNNCGARLDTTGIRKFDRNGNLIIKWGDDQFEWTSGVIAGLLDNIYVADAFYNRIQKYNSNGTFISQWGSYGPGEGQFTRPNGLTLDSSGNVYVADSGNNRITKFDPNGNAITEFRFEGTETGEFRNPVGVAADLQGNIYVVDNGNNRIQKFSPIFSFIILQSPQNQEHFTPCSLYSHPSFSWDSFDIFENYEIHFSSDSDFTSAPIKIDIQASSRQTVILPDKWKKVMMIAGASGGTVYWRVAGTRMNGTTETSEVRSMIIEPPDPAGSPTISFPGKKSLPTLAWQDNCNKKFKVLFGNDSSFTKRTTFTFNIKDPTVEDFLKTLTLGQWMTIKRLVKNTSGSTIYWYIESWDGLGRYAKTEVMSFVLSD
jgi:DNA-binding beta-propeller fold protein YncE